MGMILIAGDSWGCGEWRRTNKEYTVSHGGLGEYLHTTTDVINISTGGLSNSEIVQRITHFLAANPWAIKKITTILVFQTEWIRDYKFTDECDSDIALGYLAVKSKWISRFYYNLSKISCKYNIPIYVIGGCSDIDWCPLFNDKYPGVVAACHSLTNLLTNNDHTITEPVFFYFIHEYVINLIKKNSSFEDIKALTHDLELSIAREGVWCNNKQFFWPDGVHPNQHGHKILFDFLQNQGIIK